MLSVIGMIYKAVGTKRYNEVTRSYLNNLCKVVNKLKLQVSSENVCKKLVVTSPRPQQPGDKYIDVA